MKKILVLNVGSSSCKFQLFTEDLTLLGKGLIDKIGIDGTNLSYEDINGNSIKKEDNFDHKLLAEKLKSFISENNICDFEDVYLMAHRIVMGGEIFKENVLVEDKNTIKKITSLSPLAPLHQPYNVSLLDDFFTKYNHITHAAIFDTTFHTTIPQENYLFSIPLEFYKKHQIRRYGAHGTSHQYILEQMKKTLGKEDVTFINLHLGNGASVCLIENSKSKNTSMGLTPLGGLMMGTRSGDLDPSVVFYLMNQKKYSPEDVENIFIKKSGLLGIFEESSDMRDILKGISKNNKKAILARKMFVQRIRNYLAMYLNETKKVEAIVFTAGIGENDYDLIKEIFSDFFLKKIVIKNKVETNRKINLISEEESEIKVYVIKTNEELSMAKIAKNLLKDKNLKLENEKKINEKIIFNELENKLKNHQKEITILSTDNDIRFSKAKEILEKKFSNLKYLKIDKEFIENFDKDKKEELFNLYLDLRKEKENEEILKNNFSNPNYFATLLLKNNFADGIVSGSTHPTSEILRPGFQILKTKDKNAPISSFMWLAKDENKDLFFADISVNPDPDFEQLGKIAIQTADSVKKLFNIEPIIAMLSFSTFNSGGNHPLVEKIRKATEFVKNNSNHKVIGEIQWDAAFNEDVFKLKAKDFDLKKMPNVFIFPDLNNGNIGYKIASTLGNYLAIGPILQNIAKPINDLSRGASVEEIVNLVILTALQKIETKEEEN